MLCNVMSVKVLTLLGNVKLSLTGSLIVSVIPPTTVAPIMSGTTVVLETFDICRREAVL